MLRVKLWPLIIVVLQEIKLRGNVNTLLLNKNKLLSLAYSITNLQVVSKISYKDKYIRLRSIVQKQKYPPLSSLIQGVKETIEKSNMKNGQNLKIIILFSFRLH